MTLPPNSSERPFLLEYSTEPEFGNGKWSPGIVSKESIPPAYVAWRAGASNRVFVPALQAGNRLLGSLNKFTNSGSVNIISNVFAFRRSRLFL
jgi:hypothetical protein